MRAEICEPNDETAVARFRAALQRLGATLDDHSWAIGVDWDRLSIGDEQLSIFSDAYSIDIEGSEVLVQRVLKLYEETPP